MIEAIRRSAWGEALFSGSGLATILVALIGQAVVSIVFQIKNNEQQAALIEANRVAVETLSHQIVNLQTPLSSMVLRMDGRLSGLEVELKNLDARLTASDSTISGRIETIDRGGTRGLEIVSSAQQRALSQLDRQSERMNNLEGRLGDMLLIRQDIKRLDEQQARIIQVLDNQYNMLNDMARQLKLPPIQKKP